MTNTLLKKIKIYIFIFFIFCVGFLNLVGCKDIEEPLEVKNAVISTALNDIQSSLENNNSKSMMLSHYNPKPAINAEYEQVDDNFNNKDLAYNMITVLNRIIDSGKIELYGIESQVVSCNILEDDDTTMKFRIIVDETINLFVFEVASVGKVGYNAYICLDSVYDFKTNSLISYSIVIDGDNTPNMQEYIKYENSKLYKLKDISSVSNSISSKYEYFNNLAVTDSGYEFIQEYGE